MRCLWVTKLSWVRVVVILCTDKPSALSSSSRIERPSLRSALFKELLARRSMNTPLAPVGGNILEQMCYSRDAALAVRNHDEECCPNKRALCPRRGVKSLRGSSTSLVPRSVAALRMSATPPIYGM